MDRDDEEEVKKVEARDFDVEKRLLHHIVSKIVLPRSERFDLVTNRDIVVMYHILKEIPTNLSKLIIFAMKDAMMKRKTALPYGMALTHVFRMVGIRLRDESSCELGHTDIYNEHSLHRMGYNKVNDRWIRVRD